MSQLMHGYFQNSETETVFYNGNTFRSTHGSYKRFSNNPGGGSFGKVITACYKNMNSFNIDRREHMPPMILFIL